MSVDILGTSCDQCRSMMMMVVVVVVVVSIFIAHDSINLTAQCTEPVASDERSEQTVTMSTRVCSLSPERYRVQELCE